MSEFWSVTVPGWLTGAGTLALAGTTVYLTKRERQDRARLEVREREDRQRLEADADARARAERRQQASLISAWHAGLTFLEDQGKPPVSCLALSNRSDEPVYDVVVLLVLVQGAGAHTGEELMKNETLIPLYVRYLGVVPPGLWQVSVDGGWGGMYRAPGAEISYTDRAGVHWIRRANGELVETLTDAIRHYGLQMPFSMTDPEPFNADA